MWVKNDRCGRNLQEGLKANVSGRNDVREIARLTHEKNNIANRKQRATADAIKGSLVRKIASTYVNMPVWTVTAREKVNIIHGRSYGQELTSNNFWDSVIGCDKASSPFILSLSSLRRRITSNKGHYTHKRYDKHPRYHYVRDNGRQEPDQRR